jgi:dCMP deaminase
MKNSLLEKREELLAEMAITDNMTRLSWEQYALAIAEAAKLRSEDPWVQVGACALRYDHTVAATGYNGALAGVTIDWSDRDKRREDVVHAERNCLNYVSPGECELLVCTLMPCLECLTQIALKKIPRVMFKDVYTTDPSSAEKVFAKAKKVGIMIHQF